MARCDVDGEAVGQLSAFLDDRLQIGAVGLGGQHAASGEIEDENAAGSAVRGFACLYRKRRFFAHASSLKVYRLWKPLACLRAKRYAYLIRIER